MLGDDDESGDYDDEAVARALAFAARSFLGRLDESARMLLFHARWIAGEGRDRTIRPEHLLLGALVNPVPELASLLRASGREPQRVHDRLRRHLLRGRRWRAGAAADVMPLADECEAVFLAAMGEANRRGHAGVGALHVLAAVLRAPRPPWAWGTIRARLCYEIVDLSADDVSAALGA